ncbi:High affinity Ca2+/Mn2+ P-type ATPase-like protein [Elasticomyces elasticus]|nr:High affinity Ca2+/Mn2+ P-type ATPase-like protein [Elasticomyces elasticus]
MLGTLYTYISNLSPADELVGSANGGGGGGGAGGGRKGVSKRDTTLTFTAFVFFDMWNALTCRSASKSVLRGELKLFGPGANSMFNYAVGGSVVGQMAVVYLPGLQRVFQTEALGWRDLVWLVALASLVFWVDEGRKVWEGRGGRRGGRGWGYSRNV